MQVQDLLPYGFAVHHAGLPRADRKLVEDPENWVRLSGNCFFVKCWGRFSGQRSDKWTSGLVRRSPHSSPCLHCHIGLGPAPEKLPRFWTWQHAHMQLSDTRNILLVRCQFASSYSDHQGHSGRTFRRNAKLGWQWKKDSKVLQGIAQLCQIGRSTIHRKVRGMSYLPWTCHLFAIKEPNEPWFRCMTVDFNSFSCKTSDHCRFPWEQSHSFLALGCKCWVEQDDHSMTRRDTVLSSRNTASCSDLRKRYFRRKNSHESSWKIVSHQERPSLLV